MRCYPKQHKSSCGIDLQARRMSGCVLKEDGALVMHRHRQARPAPLLRTVAPDRDDLVGAVACGLPWDGLADLWAQEGMPFVRGHARALPALHGGLLPQADVSPAPLRAPATSCGAACLSHAHGRRAWHTARTPIARPTCPRAAHRGPTKPPAMAAPSASPIQQSSRAWQWLSP